MARKKKTKVETYDPSEAHFHATVQGVYESLVRKKYDVKSTTPFKDKRGTRLDLKFMLSPADAKKLLSQAFAIATKQGQKLGTLRKGTQKATAKGKKLAQERAKNKKHLAENIEDYEFTLAYTRKKQTSRIVRKKKGRSYRYFVEPNRGLFNKEGYKTESSAKAAATRKGVSLVKENPTTKSNPRKGDNVLFVGDTPVYYSLTGKSRLKVPSFKRLSGSKYRKPQKGRGHHSDWISKLEQARYLLSRGSQPYSDQDVIEMAEKIRLKPKKGAFSELMQEDLVASISLQFIYLESMSENGKPYLIYRNAPIAAYWTIEIYGPKAKMEFRDGQQTLKAFDPKKWRSSSWAGYGDRFLRDDTRRYSFDDEGGVIARTGGRSFGMATLQYYPGRQMTAKNGFNYQAIKEAKLAVTEGYEEWFADLETQGVFDCSKSDYECTGELNYPDDALRPVYPQLQCGSSDFHMDVLNPMLHFGTFLRAYLSLIQFNQFLLKRNRKPVDMKALNAFLKENKLDGIVNKILKDIHIAENIDKAQRIKRIGVNAEGETQEDYTYDIPIGYRQLFNDAYKKFRAEISSRGGIGSWKKYIKESIRDDGYRLKYLRSLPKTSKSLKALITRLENELKNREAKFTVFVDKGLASRNAQLTSREAYFNDLVSAQESIEEAKTENDKKKLKAAETKLKNAMRDMELRAKNDFAALKLEMSVLFPIEEAKGWEDDFAGLPTVKEQIRLGKKIRTQQKNPRSRKPRSRRRR